VNTFFTIEMALWLFAAVAAFIIGSAITLRSWLRFARRARGELGYALPRQGPPTALEQIFDSLEVGNPGLNGVMSLFDNSDAFAVRVHSAQLAGRSLDVMTYIWRTDLTGWLLLRDVLAAADRGVRVRLLLDDVAIQGFDPVFFALSQHKNIEVRLFNPLRNRGNLLRRVLETALGLSRYNRRLHSKAWIVDGRLGIVGGRNISDTYFGRLGRGIPGIRPRISHDADLVLCGPCVTELEAVFDSYWNLSLSLPIKALLPTLKISLKWFRRQVTKRCNATEAVDFFSDSVGDINAATALTKGMHWVKNVWVLADPPEKALGQKKSAWMYEKVRDFLASAQQDVRLITPYFVPGVDGSKDLEKIVRRGVNLSILTNSLAASDNILVHGAYRHYRRPLLALGARLFEFAPRRQKGMRRDVLHSKVFIVDHSKILIGSLNFDMRSAHTNAELGVIVEHPALAAEALAAFDRDSGPDQAYALSYEDKAIIWRVAHPKIPFRMTVEPEAPVVWRALSWTVGHLPIHGWL